jgi:hypothetical protein
MGLKSKSLKGLFKGVKNYFAKGGAGRLALSGMATKLTTKNILKGGLVGGIGAGMYSIINGNNPITDIVQTVFPNASAGSINLVLIGVVAVVVVVVIAVISRRR